MTKEQKLEICVRELLYGISFLSDYQKELSELLQNRTFMEVVDEISMSVPEATEFSLDSFSEEFKSFKKNKINQSFFERNLRKSCPAYDEILSSVMNRGKTGLSATISVYYALRYLEISALKPVTRMDEIKKVSSKSVEMVSDQDYRKKWPAEFRCEDGHYVRSKNEQLLDNWLYNHGICHAYEPLVVDKITRKEYLADFYLPNAHTYIEIWGFETPEYLNRKEIKTKVYRANGLKLLQMTDSDVKVLDDYMRRYLADLL